MRRSWILLLWAPLALAAEDAAERGPIELTLRRAVEVALSPEGSTRVQLAEEAVKQAQSRALEARAALLPDFEGVLNYQNETVNLAAFGIQFSSPFPGFQIPTLVGPFSVIDARASVQQTVFDFSSIRRFQSSRV